MNRISKLLEFLRDSENDSFLKHALALEYIKEGDDNKAHELFKAILAYEPGYVGSYFHLGKLLIRKEQFQEAAEIFQKGMEEATRAGDKHSYAELQAALEELED